MNNILKAHIFNAIQLMLCILRVFTTGIVQAIILVLWVIAIVMVIVYMTKAIKGLKEERTYEEGFVKGFCHNIDVVEELETELESSNSRVRELSKRLMKALGYINEKAPGVSTLILDTENKAKLIDILTGSDK